MVIVVDQPSARDFPSLLERLERIQAQNFLSMLAVEPLDVSVLIRLARPDVVNHDAVCSGPFDELVHHELWPLSGEARA